MRARYIKPGFFKNEILAGFPLYVRLVYVSTWLVADRDGRFEDRPLRLRLEAFPNDPTLDVDAALGLLADGGFLQRYSVDGERYVQIIAWHKHQHPHRREAPSVIPPPSKPHTKPDPWQETDGKARRTLSVSTPEKAGPRTDQGQTKDRPTTGLYVVQPGGVRITESVLLKNSYSSSAGAADPAKVEGAKPKNTNGHAHGLTVDDVIALWHERMPELPRVQKLTDARAASIRARIREDLPELDDWRDFFAFIRERPFLMGKAPPTALHPRPFRPSLFWFCKAENYAKCAEGNYT